MSKKLRRIFFIYFVFILVFFIGIFFCFYNYHYFSFRKLSYSNEDVEKICKDISSDVYEFFYNENFFFDLPPIKNDTNYIDSLTEIIDLKLKKILILKNILNFIYHILLFY
jgi:hypothetical protein